jgi:single-stranded-DNA-specific exonuclease
MAPPSRWSCTPYSVAAAERLREQLGVAPVTAAILVRRGYREPDAARAFLAAEERHDPFLFAGMSDVCDSLREHVRRGSRIVVHGDYDVDGVCSTAILVRALRALGAEPRWHIPSRADGYGLSAATVERLAAEGTDLLLTADCAITAVEEIALARARGLAVIVTDHHRPAEALPDCPILHPELSGYPFPDLCAAGVAHKLAEALAGREAAEEDLDLVALATVADVVALRGENRRLVREGLRTLARTRKAGLRALMSVAQVDAGTVTEHALGFRLAPRLNAAGRLQRADAALELVLTEDESRAAQVADELDILNRERQDTETRILFEAEAARAEHPEAPAYVLAGEGWHPGVIGIVASRMVERYNRPCVVIALDGDGGRGSGRSIRAFDLHAGLAACAPYLRRFGGHRAAAGLDIERSQVDAFREAFVRHAASVLSPADLVPEQRVDAVVPGDALGVGLAEELERLAPFGHGNPGPTLLVPAARIGEVRSMGEDGQHARFTLSGGGSCARAVAFRTAARQLPSSEEERYDAAVKLELNEWRGAVEPRLVLRALCPTERGTCGLVDEGEPFLDAFACALEGDAPQLEPVGPARRTLRDRRGEGFAGVAGDLISSGERVLVVCADSGRRRESVEAIIGGIAASVRLESSEPCENLGIADWEALAADPRIAERYEHLLALDPPASPHGAELLVSLPAASGAGFAHLAWGAAEVEFALAVARRSLDMREELVALYRELRAAGTCSGEALAAVLRGSGAHPRPARHAAALVRVLAEVDLLAVEHGPHAITCRLRPAGRTQLERSPSYLAALERYAVARGYLGGAAVARAA